MNHIIKWLHQADRTIFLTINHKFHHRILDRVLGIITHLGGATFCIVLTLTLFFWSSEPWRTISLHCILALVLSHIPVAIFKRKLQRLRPYLVLPEAKTVPKPLKDHSFPSGHTTAIFSVTVPYMLAFPLLTLLLLPLAIIVGLSRIYLGLHYPSDVIVGGIVGTAAAAVTAAAF